MHQMKPRLPRLLAFVYSFFVEYRVSGMTVSVKE